MNILFVCLGNVARSQMAEAFYNTYTKSSDAKSAGVLDFTPAKYVHPVVEVVQVMKEEGIDVSNYLVKTITREMVDNVDKIYIMCKKEEYPEVLLAPGKAVFWQIPDPFGSSLQNYQQTKEAVKSKVLSILP